MQSHCPRVLTKLKDLPIRQREALAVVVEVMHKPLLATMKRNLTLVFQPYIAL